MINDLNYGQLHKVLLALRYSFEIKMSQFSNAIEVVTYFKPKLGNLILIPKFKDETPVSAIHLAAVNLALDKHGVTEARLNRCLGQVMRPDKKQPERPEFKIVAAQLDLPENKRWTWTMYSHTGTPLCRDSESRKTAKGSLTMARMFRRRMNLTEHECEIEQVPE